MAITGDPTYGPWDTSSSWAGTWQCGSCLAWIPCGQMHACAPMQMTVTGLDLTAEDRIASALERIAAALESSNEKED